MHELSDQHVFRCVGGVGGVGVRAVPGERAVGGGECLAGVLLLQERVCARGGDVDVQDLRSRHVQQPAGAHGVLELLGGSVLRALRGGRQRDVLVMSARAVVAGRESELQLVSIELAGCGGERVAEQLQLRRRVHGGKRRPVLGMRGGAVQKRDRHERVCALPGRDVFAARGKCVRLSCESVCKRRSTWHYFGNESGVPHDVGRGLGCR